LSVEGNPTLYKWLYETTFDTSAIKRRWNRSALPSWHFQESQAPPIESAVVYRDGKRQSVENAYTAQFRIPGSSSSAVNLDFDNNHLLFAEEYRDRMKMFRRSRAWNHLEDEYSAPATPRAVEDDDMQMVHDLWMMWWMVTEHGSYLQQPSIGLY
jgi:hypothetical protein